MPNRGKIPVSTLSGEKQDIISQLLDPSSRTIEQMQREISHLKELAFSKIEAMEKAIEVAHDDLTRVPTEVQKQVAALKELLETKIVYEAKIRDIQVDHLEKQFAWVEKVRLEQKKDSADALMAALNAAKEAVSEQNKSAQQAITKSEAATTKQIDGLSDKINDVKDRTIRAEGTGAGKGSIIAYVIAGISMFFTLITVLILIYKTFSAK